MRLTLLEWTVLQRAHEQRADAFTAEHLARRSRGEKHPVQDFLFDYYSTRPAVLRKWHPGIGVVLETPVPHVEMRWYVRVPDGVTLDLTSYLDSRGDTVRFVQALLSATASRPAFTGCFGLHEWAMAYRTGDLRHSQPLRLGPAGTDAVVESHGIVCTHFDAFRFFSPEAAPLNRLQPTRQQQVALEQPGCLHATMDLHKWATKLGPIVPGELALDCFELARDTRTLDMQASPYDLFCYGVVPVAIETPEGKAEYVSRQRAVASRAAVLRVRLLSVCEQVFTRTE